jgi:hypothetical protein
VARVIVLPDALDLSDGLTSRVTLDERVDTVILADVDSSLRFIERVAGAIQDADGPNVGMR